MIQALYIKTKMPTYKIKLSKKEFDSGRIPSWNHHVIVEMEHTAEGYTTKAGIIVGFNIDDIYSEGTESHAADLTEVYGKVVKVPKFLDYDPDDLNHMSWLPHMEVEVGDYVWFNHLISRNCSEIIVDHKLHKVIPYEDLFVARKGGRDGEIMPLNGICLLEEVYDTPKSSFDTLSQHKILKDRGRVAYVGKPNKEYQSDAFKDISDVKVGDLVYFTMDHIPIYLERKKFIAGFLGNNLYYATQRRRMALALRDESCNS